MGIRPEDVTSVADRARRRITRRTMPYLLLLFIVAYLDRVNVGYAKLAMVDDLRFSPEVYGMGAGIFFIGYFLLEIPGSIIVEKWSARGWIARIMITWGILAVITGFIKTSGQFYLIRFLLGAAEAGFFPGIIIYLSHWFRAEDRAKAVAMLMIGIPISSIVGSPLSGLLMTNIKWLGLPGWRWVFILEGIPAVIFGFVTIFYLTDRPHQAKWLPEDERNWITTELEREKQAKLKTRSYRITEAFRHREVILLTLAYFFMVTSLYGLSLWLPTILKQASGSSNLVVSFITAIPYIVGLISMLLMGWSSDKTGERRWHTALAMMATCVGLLLSTMTQNHLGLTVATLCLAAVGTHGYLPGFWALPTSFLTGTAAAASVGLINSVGNLGGFVGPYIVGYLNEKTKSFFSGILFLSSCAFIAACFVVAMRTTKKEEPVAEPQVKTSVQSV